MKASFVHTNGFRTFLWCVMAYACVFTLANIDNFRAMATADDVPAALSAGDPAPVWRDGALDSLDSYESEAWADRDHYLTDHYTDHTGLLVTVSERAETLGI